MGVKEVAGVNEDSRILHPRPSSIVAALYTMRDLGVDVVILHGPSGCSFKHARLMEEDGMRVVTTGMDEPQFIFGGEPQLTDLLHVVVERFKPELIGVVGTCASMIIGEDMHSIAAQAKINVPILVVDVHAGYSDNTIGVIRTLEAAEKQGIISDEELSRQKHILEAATRVEKEHGAASKDYLPPERGDTKYGVARRLIEMIDCGLKGLNIMNAKKETAYTFIDMNLAVSEIARVDQITTMANLNPTLGLPRVRQYASEISRELEARGFSIDHCIGGLDEYGVAGKVASRMIKELYADCDFAVITGVPHALPMDALENMEIFSITNGPRQVEPLKEMGHQHVIVELDLHPKNHGVHSIVESEFGATLRELSQNRG